MANELKDLALRLENLEKQVETVARQPSAQDLSAEDLKAYVKENLASYKVPREFVFLDELPRNATGKVLKRELAAS